MNTNLKQLFNTEYIENNAMWVNIDGEYFFANRIPEFDDYLITTCGKVLSTKREKLSIIKNSKNGNNNYVITLLYKQGKAFKRYIHRLVADAFYLNGECDKFGNLRSEVNHKDGNPQNNKISNLERVSRQENVYHRKAVLNKKS